MESILDSIDRQTTSTAYRTKVRVRQKYQIVGFISSGTYGRVYKAINRNSSNSITGDRHEAHTSAPREVFAIKKFKPDKEGETIQYTGLSQSAIREMSLCTELSHPNLIHLVEIILEDKCIFMVFEYCEHDLLQIIQHHTQPARHPIPASMIKSILFQLLNGLLYLHRSWVLHRDLKPANIMVTSNGAVRIGDLGLARVFRSPLTSLYSGDKVVVTIWYRSPELLLGSKHYTPAVDLWAVGCIFAELLSLRPIFKGEEAKGDSKKSVPFQRHQMTKIMEVLGPPDKQDWPGIVGMPDYGNLQALIMGRGGTTSSSSSSSLPFSSSSYSSMTSTGADDIKVPAERDGRHDSDDTRRNPGLQKWYNNILRTAYHAQPLKSDATDDATASTVNSTAPLSTNSTEESVRPPEEQSPGARGFSLLSALLDFDPSTRLTADKALQHPYFSSRADADIRTNADARQRGKQDTGFSSVSTNCFAGLTEEYPSRRVSSNDDNGNGAVSMGSFPVGKRGDMDSSTKRQDLGKE